MPSCVILLHHEMLTYFKFLNDCRERSVSSTHESMYNDCRRLHALANVTIASSVSL